MVASLFEVVPDFDKIARLTDRQKVEILNHKRDKKTGAIIWPKKEDSISLIPSKENESPEVGLKKELKAAKFMAGILAMTDSSPGTYEEKVVKHLKELEKGLRERFANQPVEQDSLRGKDSTKEQ